MLKSKVAVLVAAATISLSASAGLVQYDVSGSFADGATVNGFFVQDTGDQSVAFYELRYSGSVNFAMQHYTPSANDNLYQAYTHFLGDGPSSFSVTNDQAVLVQGVGLEFFSSPVAGQYRMAGWVSGLANADSWPYQAYIGFDNSLSGLAVEGVMDEGLRVMLVDHRQEIPINHVVPAFTPGPVDVPEPGSLALMFAGVAAALAVRRRKANSA